MKIVIDERERDLYERCSFLITNKLSPESIKDVSKEVLCLGDIVFRGDDGVDIIIIERKSICDLLSSIKDSRYEEQSYRLTHASGLHPHKILYIIEGIIHSIKRDTDIKTVYSAMTSLNMFKGFSVIRTCNINETANLIMAMADKINRNAKKNIPLWTPSHIQEQPNSKVNISEPVIGGSGNENNDEAINIMTDVSEPVNYCTVVKKVKKDNITTENFGEIILTQVPGVSSVSAIAIMKHFRSPLHLIDSLRNTPDCLSTIHIEAGGKSRKLGKNVIFNIKKYLTEEAYETSRPNSV